MNLTQKRLLCAVGAFGPLICTALIRAVGGNWAAAALIVVLLFCPIGAFFAYDICTGEKAWR